MGDLGNDLVNTVEPERRVERQASDIVVHQDDPATPVAIDLRHDLGEWLIVEDQQTPPPCADVAPVHRGNPGEALRIVSDLLVRAQPRGLAVALDLHLAIQAGDCCRLAFVAQIKRGPGGACAAVAGDHDEGHGRLFASGPGGDGDLPGDQLDIAGLGGLPGDGEAGAGIHLDGDRVRESKPAPFANVGTVVGRKFHQRGPKVEWRPGGEICSTTDRRRNRTPQPDAAAHRL